MITRFLRKFLIVPVVISCFPILTNAQTLPTLDWQKCIGGSVLDAGNAIIQTYDGGYAVLGSVQSSDGDVIFNNGDMDLFVTKLSSSGAILWSKTFGGTAYDYGYFIQQTSDSGYVIAAATASVDGNVSVNKGVRDAWIIKLDKAGNLQWEKTYGGKGMDIALYVRQIAGGGYIFTGWSSSTDGDLTSNKGDEDAWVVKLDANGNIVWQKSYGGSDEDHFTAVVQISDGSYLAAGSVKSNDGDVTGHHGSDDYWIVKLDTVGNISWQKTLGGSGEDHCGDHGFAGSIEQTFDGGYVFSGWSNSTDGDVTGNHGFYDCWIVKLGGTGSLVWQKSIGGSRDDEAFYLVQMQDSSLIACGTTNSTNYNISGDSTDYDAWVFQLDQGGNLQWQKAFGGPSKEVVFAMDRTKDTSVIMTGYARGNGGQVTGYKGGISDIWVAKLKMPVINDVHDIAGNNFYVLPNPSTGTVTVQSEKQNISLLLYNSMGQLIKQSSSKTIQFPEAAAGLYILHVYDEDKRLLYQTKIMKQ